MVSDCSISGFNTAGGGGGIFAEGFGLNVTVSDSTITGNTAEGDGGGICVQATTVELSNRTIRGNTAGGNGGAILSRHSTHGYITDVGVTGCSIIGNAARGDGGGIFSDSWGSSPGGELAVQRSTFFGNAAHGSGGAISIVSLAGRVRDCTITGNSADLQGGGLYSATGISLSGSNSIVAGNQAPSAPDVGGGGYSNGGYNLIGIGGPGQSYGSLDQVGTTDAPIDAGLAPLDDYGGPTLTLALMPGSPALGRGDPGRETRPDQRGFVAGNVPSDVGSFQTQASLAVNTTADGRSGFGQMNLRQALNLARVYPGAEAIGFDPAVFATPQTVMLDPTIGTVVVDSDVIIEGPDAGFTLARDTAENAPRFGILSVVAGVTATLRRVTLTGGVALAGGGLVNEGDLSLDDCSIVGNAAIFGGGIGNTGSLSLSDCVVLANSATAGAGILNGIGGRMSLEWTTVDGNGAVDATYEGGGIANHGILFVDSCRLSNGKAAYGGALHNYADGQATAVSTRLAGNAAASSGGGASGGAVCNLGQLRLSSCQFDGNTAAFGGALNNAAGGTASAVLCVFTGQTAGYGGALCNTGWLTVQYATADANTADYGGALFNQGDARVESSTIRGNTACTGGGVNNSAIGGMLWLVDSTVCDNAAVQGGGLANLGTATLVSCTIAANRASSEAGGLRNWGTATLRNTLIATNTAGYAAPDVAGEIVSQGNNLVSAADGCTGLGAPGDEAGTADGPIDPLLGPLGYHGGPTATLPLLPGSPAIDAGAPGLADSADQRGVARGGPGGPDIGAFESRGFNLSFVYGDSQRALIRTTFDTPLAVLVSSRYGEPVAGGRVGFTAPSDGAAARLDGAPATIADDGTAAVVAVANAVVGIYAVVASAAGAAPIAFTLTNTGVSIPTLPPDATLVFGAALDLLVFVPQSATGGTPTGDVTFYDGERLLGVAPLGTGEFGSCATLHLAPGLLGAGVHHVAADYGGDATNPPSASDALTFELARATPSLTAVGGTFVYDAAPHPAAIAAVGAMGEPLGPVSVMYNGQTDLPVNAGTYAVVATFERDDNYVPATATATLTVAKATPLFADLAAPTILGGTPEVVLGGRIAAGAFVPPGVVTIELAGLTRDATIASDGSFHAEFPASALEAGSYLISYRFAGDANIESAQASTTLTVKPAYSADALFDQDKAHEAGSTIPIRLRVRDDQGVPVGSDVLPVVAVAVVGPDGAALVPTGPGQANPDGRFPYDPLTGKYQYNLKSTGYRPGRYTLLFRIGDDPTLHRVSFVIR